MVADRGTSRSLSAGHTGRKRADRHCVQQPEIVVAPKTRFDSATSITVYGNPVCAKIVPAICHPFTQ